MFFKEPSRTYNTLALESWFIYIQNNWESQFTEKELSAGRDLYIEGSISGLELSQEDATINYSRSRKELFYSIIECVENRFKVRTSTEDQFLGRVIAVAGLYEIEELIADEISPIKVEMILNNQSRLPKNEETNRINQSKECL